MHANIYYRGDFMAAGVRAELGTFTIDQQSFQELIAFTRTETFQASRDRVSEFFRADKTQELMLHVGAIGGATTIGLTVAGGVAGGFASGGTAPGILIGAGIGFGAGVIGTGIAEVIATGCIYDDWKRGVEDKTILTKFKEVYQEHPVLNRFVCPVTQEIIRDPVQIPCGHTFEKAALLQWHDEKVANNISPTCPECRTVFTKTQFGIDVTLMGKIKRTYGDIIRNEMQNPIHSPGVLEGFKALEQSMNIQVQEVLKDVSTKLTLQLNAGEITPQAFTRKMREVSELYPQEEDPE